MDELQNSGPKELIVNLACNAIIPFVILSKLSGPDKLGTFYALIVALAFPLMYGAFDLIKSKKVNLFSVLGLVSVLLTGGLALMELDGFWFAVKEASIPLLIGIFILYTLNHNPLIKRLFFNEKLFKVKLIEDIVKNNGTEKDLEDLFKRSTLYFAFSTLVSAILNFVLAIIILKAPAGSVEFNQQLGEMTALSFPVIVIPSMGVSLFALFYLFKGIKKLTGMEIEDLMNQEKVENKDSAE